MELINVDGVLKNMNVQSSSTLMENKSSRGARLGRLDANTSFAKLPSVVLNSELSQEMMFRGDRLEAVRPGKRGQKDYKRESINVD